MSVNDPEIQHVIELKRKIREVIDNKYPSLPFIISVYQIKIDSMFSFLLVIPDDEAIERLLSLEEDLNYSGFVIDFLHKHDEINSLYDVYPVDNELGTKNFKKVYTKLKLYGFTTHKFRVVFNMPKIKEYGVDKLLNTI